MMRIYNNQYWVIHYNINNNNLGNIYIKGLYLPNQYLYFLTTIYFKTTFNNNTDFI